MVNSLHFSFRHLLQHNEHFSNVSNTNKSICYYTCSTLTFKKQNKKKKRVFAKYTPKKNLSPPLVYIALNLTLYNNIYTKNTRGRPIKMY